MQHSIGIRDLVLIAGVLLVSFAGLVWVVLSFPAGGLRQRKRRGPGSQRPAKTSAKWTVRTGNSAREIAP